MRWITVESIARLLMTIVLLSLGFPGPFGFSSLAVFVMIISLPVLALFLPFRRYSATDRRFLRNNLILASIIGFYALVALFYGAMSYPSYLISIAIHQLFFGVCLVFIGADGVWQAFKIAASVNVGFIAIQIVGGIAGSEYVAGLHFLGLMNGNSREYWGPIPRASGLMTEPAHLSYLLLPPLLVCLIAPRGALRSMRRGRAVFALGYLLTLSLVAYVQLGITMIISSVRLGSLRRFAVVAIISSATMVAVYEAVPLVRVRVEGLLTMSDEGTKSSSVFALESNALVAAASLRTAPLLGHGITSHRKSYDEMISSIFEGVLNESWMDLNRNDADSLILLLLSETGIVGLSLFLLFVGRSIFIFLQPRDEISVLGLAHALSLAVVGIRSGQIASMEIMLNMEVVLYCLAARYSRGPRVACGSASRCSFEQESLFRGEAK